MIIRIFIAMALTFSPETKPSHCTNEPIKIHDTATLNTLNVLENPLIFTTYGKFKITISRKFALDHLAKREVKLKNLLKSAEILKKILINKKLKDLPLDSTKLKKELFEYKGKNKNDHLLATHEISVLFVSALRKGTAYVERIDSKKRVNVINVEVYTATEKKLYGAINGIRFLSNKSKVYDYCTASKK